MTKNTNRIIMLIVGIVTFLLLGLMYAWSVIRIEISKVFSDYTATQLSLCFSLTSIFFCFGGLFSGKFSEKFCPAYSLRIAAVVLFASYWGTSFMGSLASRPALVLLYICYSLLGGFGTGIAYNAIMTNISPWFPEHVGLTSGVMLMGFGMSSLGYAFVIEKLAETMDIFTILRLLGSIIVIAVLVTSFFVKKPPLAAKSEAGGEEVRSYTTREMVSSLSFWVYFLWNSLSGGSGLMIINSAANIASYFGLAASLGMVISVFNGCGRPFAGALVDKLGQFKSMLIMVCMLITAALMLIIADNGAGKGFMFVGLILVGVIYGGGSIISTKVIRDLYGPAHFGTNHSIANFCMISGSLIGPMLSGVLQDKSGGGFTSTFWALLALGVLMLALLMLLMLCVKRERKTHKA